MRPRLQCLECGWDQADYDAVEQTYSCMPSAPAPSSGAPAPLAALAASLLAIECGKRLAGDDTGTLEGRDLLVDASHEPWRITPLAGSADATLGETLAIGSTLRDAGAGLWFGVAGQRLATELHCAACGTTRSPLRSTRG